MNQAIEIDKYRQRALGLVLEKANGQNPIDFDYLLDEYLRNIYGLPERPEGTPPYISWMIGVKEAEAPRNRISENGANFIKKWEGCRTQTYLCSARVPTIGYGHTKGVKLGMRISVQEADRLFLEDIKVYEDAVSNSVKVPLNQNQFDALVSFCFNVGVGALKKSTLLRVLNQGNYEEAAKQFLRWTRAGSKVVQGLVNRRKKEKELFES